MKSLVRMASIGCVFVLSALVGCDDDPVASGPDASPGGGDAVIPPFASAKALSPDGSIEVRLQLLQGVPQYYVARQGRVIISGAGLGMAAQGGLSLDRDFVIDSLERDTVDTVWRPVWGQSASVRENYNELTAHLVQVGADGEIGADAARLDIVFRVFNDGVGLRYAMPAQEGLETISVTEDLTEFRFAQPGTAWWTPADFEGDEFLYNTGAIDQVEDANTPFTVRLDDGTHVAVHEADLEDYATMTLAAVDDDAERALRAALVPARSGANNTEVKAERVLPFETPWRTLTIGAQAGDLMESNLVLNLNDPCAICDGDTSWIQPSKYVGVWWEIHKGTSTWEPGDNVAATTENTKAYIDFAAEHGFPYVLAEGWNDGWEGSWTDMDFLTSNDKFDLQEVVSYGKDKGVKFMAHMETGANVEGFEAQIDDAFALYESLGIDAIKTGYVGSIPGYHHYSQRMVNHYATVARKAAEHKIMVNAHEPVKPTGERRTYPNFMSREGLRGMEWNAWSAGNPPSHTLILPFTRMLGGPVDYNPGIFNPLWLPDKVPDNPFFGSPPTRVHSTRARQLALYVILFSGVQMVTDVPENYEGQPEIAFIKQVPVSWDETRVLAGEIGEFISVARRKGDEWYLGSGTNDEARTLEIALDFLGEGTYVAESYTDAAAADFVLEPTHVEMASFLVNAADTLVATMEVGGGQAVRLRPATAADLSALEPYEKPALTVEITDIPSEAWVDDFVVISARVSNPGSLVGGQALALMADGEEVQSRLIRVDGGTLGESAALVEFEARFSTPGMTEVIIGDAAPVQIAIASREGAPLSPSAVRITDVKATSISLEWDEVPNAVGYQVFRREAHTIYGHTPHAEVDGTTTVLVDEDDIRLGATYSYMVRAVFAGDVVSPASNEVTETAEVPVVAVTFRVRVPDSTPPDDEIYMPGSIDQLGPWDPGLLRLSKVGEGLWEVTVDIAEGTSVQYKFTRASWERVEWWGPITGPNNRSLVVETGVDSMLVEHVSTDWDNAEIPDHRKAVRFWRDPLVVQTSPSDGASGAAPSEIEIVFERDIRALSGGYADAMRVTREGEEIAGAVTEDTAGTLVFRPDTALAAGVYEVYVSEVESVLDETAAMQAPYTFSFTVE